MVLNFLTWVPTTDTQKLIEKSFHIVAPGNRHPDLKSIANAFEREVFQKAGDIDFRQLRYEENQFNAALVQAKSPHWSFNYPAFIQGMKSRLSTLFSHCPNELRLIDEARLLNVHDTPALNNFFSNLKQTYQKSRPYFYFDLQKANLIKGYIEGLRSPGFIKLPAEAYMVAQAQRDWVQNLQVELGKVMERYSMTSKPEIFTLAKKTGFQWFSSLALICGALAVWGIANKAQEQGA